MTDPVQITRDYVDRFGDAVAAEQRKRAVEMYRALWSYPKDGTGALVVELMLAFARAEVLRR